MLTTSATIILISSFVGIVSAIFWQSFLAAEKQQAQKQVNYVLEDIDNRVDRLDAQNLDFANLDETSLRQISRSDILVRFYPIEAQDLPIPLTELPAVSLDKIRLDQHISAHFQLVDENTISSYTLLLDFANNPALVLRVDSPRTIYQEGKQSWQYLMLFTLMLGGVTTGMTYKFSGALVTHLKEREKIRRELFLEKEMAQVTLQSISEGLVTIDRQGCIEAINPVAEKLMGYASAEAKGKNFSQVFHVIEEQSRKISNSAFITTLEQGKVNNSCDRDLLVSQDGREFAIDYSIAPIRSFQGEIMGAVIVFRDVTEARRMAQQLSWQASYDPLTGLANRREFERYLRRAIATAKRGQQEHTLAFLDIDRFKIVNDTSGHIAGDELLRQISMLLQDNLRQTDMISRFGADEFAILLYSCKQEKAIMILQGLVELIKGFRFVWQDKLFTLGASVGVTAVTADSPDVTQILSRADAACYVAKEQGRNRVYVYCQEDANRPHGEMEWAAKIQQALENDQFRLYYQTISPLPGSSNLSSSPVSNVSVVNSLSNGNSSNLGNNLDNNLGNNLAIHREQNIKDKHVKDKNTKDKNNVTPFPKPSLREEHYEILLRLVDQDNSLIMPSVFMPAAERYHLMPMIDRWVIKNLFSLEEIWEIYRHSPCQSLFTINLSGASLNEESFWEFLVEQIDQYKIPPHLLCFEITETVAIANITKTSRFIRQMRELGCRFSLDDFGSGMSSFGYLKNLPVDYLKIDGEFIKDIVESSTNVEIAAAIHRIGHVMGMQTIAEYVTNQKVWQKVAAIGIDYAQGYYINRPQPLNPKVFLESKAVS